MINKILPQKIDSTTDLKLTSENSMVDALNVRYSRNDSASNSDGADDSSGDAGVLKNVKGTNRAQPYNAFDDPQLNENVTRRVIGSVTDNKTKIVYFFVWSSLETEHGVYAYDPYGKLPKNESEPIGLKDSVRLIFKSKYLRFPQDGFVSADIVRVNNSEFENYSNIEEYMKSQGIWDDMNTDALLYFTDNVNEPKKINIYRALLNNAQQTSGGNANTGYSTYSEPELFDFFHSCQRTPLNKIDFEFAYDEAFSGSNFKNTNSFQFAYQFVYKDGIESSISPYSLNAVPVVLLEQGALTTINYVTNNVCVLTIPGWNREVDFVKILVREGDNGSWSLLDEVSTTADSEDWIYASRNYKFYNNKILTGISAEEVSKQYDNVPKKAQSEVVSNNRLFYGNYVDGFDNVKVKAKIKAEYKDRAVERDTSVKIIPGVRPHAIWGERMGLSDKINRNLNYNGGANYIIDSRSVDEINNGEVVTFTMSISPDQNFHVYRKGGVMPCPNVKTADRYINDEPFFENINNSNINENAEYFVSGSSVQSAVENKFIWGDYPIKNNLNYKYFNPSNNSSVTFNKAFVGSSSSNPLILLGGQISFEISFKYTGPNLFGSEAAELVGLTISELLSDTQITHVDEVEVLYRNNEYVHEIDLGLSDFDKIITSRSLIGCDSNGNNLSSAGPADYRSNLVCAIGDKSSSLYGINAPIGYFIINKAKVTFVFDFVKKANGNQGSVCEILLSIKEVKNIETFTCIRRPNSAVSPWYVISKETLSPQNIVTSNNVNQILSEIYGPSVPNIDAFFKLTNSSFGDSPTDWLTYSSGAYGNNLSFWGFKRQFGFLELNEITQDDLQRNAFYLNENLLDQGIDIILNQGIIGFCVTDGESGFGGVNGSAQYNELELNKCGSVPMIHNYFPNETIRVVAYNGVEEFFDVVNDGGGVGANNNLLYGLGGVFFNGRIDISVTSPTIHLGGFATQSTGIPFGIVTQYEANKLVFAPLRSNFEETGKFYLNESEFVTDFTHAEIEPLYFNSSLILGEFYSGYRSFKANSMHEFGVIFYDERGRHGFVNPIGSFYVPGYSDQERGSGNKGKVDLVIDAITTAPSWAKYFQYAHTKSTSIGDFVQYSAGGAFARHGGDDETNIYVSLNYLQTSIVSYVSSFGARSPEGGVQMYKYKKGDRLRVISYQTMNGTTKYPNNFDFEIVDVVNIGDSNNPLHEGTTPPPFNKMGEFVILKDNPTTYPFNYATVKNGSHSWGDNCIIELYSPLKVSEQEQKIYYEIGPVVPIGPSGIMQTVTLTEGDVWWRKVALNTRKFENGIYNDILIDTLDSGGSNASKSNFKSYYLETKTFSDLVRGDSIGVGRPNTVLKNAKETRNESSITYSEPTAAASPRSFYSSFNYSTFNYKDIPDVYGAINFMLDRGDSILVIQENKISYVPISRNLISDNAGSDFLVSSTDILGTARFFAGNAGCDNNPESVVDVDGTVYFVHKSAAKVYKLTATGIEDVTTNGIESYLRGILKGILNSSEVISKSDIKVIGGYDPLNDEYLFTIKKIPLISTDGGDTTGFEPIKLFSASEYGCTNPNACNYDPSARYDNGSCVFPIPGRDCNGVCIEDIDGDNVCDELDFPIILGCTNPSACNYDQNATFDNGSCWYPEPGLDCNGDCAEFHPNTSFGVNATGVYQADPVCITVPLRRGCTDPEAYNYNSKANYPYNAVGQFMCVYTPPPEPIIAFTPTGQIAIGGGASDPLGVQSEGDGQTAVGGGVDSGPVGGGGGGDQTAVGGGGPQEPVVYVIRTFEDFINHYGLKYADIKKVFDFTRNNPVKIHSAFNTYDLDDNGNVGTEDLLHFFTLYGTDLDENYLIAPNRPVETSYYDSQINSIMNTLLTLQSLYVSMMTQVQPLTDVNVSSALDALASLPPGANQSDFNQALAAQIPETTVTDLLNMLSEQ